MSDSHKSLTGFRVLAALNGLELFGHERGNIEVFKTLRDLGAEVLVGVNGKAENHVKDDLSHLGFATFDLPFGPQWSIQWVRKSPSIALTNVLAVLRCSWIFRSAIRDFRPTHVHLGSPLAYSYLSLALALSTVPLVYRMGDCAPVDSPFNLRIWRMAMRRSSHIIANSRFVLNSALAAGVSPSKVSVIHNLAPSHTEATEEDGSSLAQDRGRDIIYVGAISEHKGLVPLVEAFAQIAPDFPDMQLNILGGSRYDSAFRSQITRTVSSKNLQDRISFHGHVRDTSEQFRQAALHVAPALWEEPFANVVLEAKREGTPSVVFPSGGLPEMVRHQVDGYICRERSAEALVEGLRWMLEDPARLRHMGEAAAEDSEARFGHERFARAWANVYRTVI